MGFLRFFVRSLAFLRKEIAEIIRQPRLVLTLVVGPFLVLLLFGLGYSSQNQPIHATFVVPQGSPLGNQLETYAKDLGSQFVYTGRSANQKDAETRLSNNQADVAVIIPDRPFESVARNQQAKIVFLYDEIDPLRVQFIQYMAQVFTSVLNRYTLQGTAQDAKQNAGRALDDVTRARQATSTLIAALQSGQVSASQRAQLSSELSTLQGSAGAALALAAALGTMQVDGSATPQQQGQGQTGSALDSLLNELQSQQNALNQPASSQSEELARLNQLNANLAQLQTQLTQFQNVDPAILVQPFASDPRGVAVVQPTLGDYFAPGVIILLLQHLAVTFGALSFVRDRRLGVTELFGVSPLKPFEALLGKYLSYLIFSGIMGAVLTALVVLLLRVPMLGSWYTYSLAVGLLIFASLGLGFVLSLLAETESQAVQYSMIVLIASVFFTGFSLALQQFTQPVRSVSWLFPATYGIALLRDIMLRGQLSQLWLLIVLGLIGLLFAVLSWLLLRRRFRLA